MNEYKVLIWVASLVAISAVGAWWGHRRLKKKLERGLGRKVHDLEVSSLSRWMEAAPGTIDEVLHDDSLARKVQQAMEGAVDRLEPRRDRNSEPPAKSEK